MIQTEGVLHFTIPVKDLDRSEKFYTEILGMEKLRRTGHMVFLRAAGKDNFVLTYSEKPIDPNPAGKHEIHSAFRLTADEYDRAKAFLAVARRRDLQGGGPAPGHVPGPQRLFPRSRQERDRDHAPRARAGGRQGRLSRQAAGTEGQQTSR